MGNASKNPKRTEKLKPTYKLKKKTIGSIKIIRTGRNSVTVIRAFTAANPDGPDFRGGDIPKRFARCCRMIFLYVSFMPSEYR